MLNSLKYLQNEIMSNLILREILSKNIKKYRKGKFTQEKLAEQINVSAQNINDIEGKRRWPRDETIEKIAQALEIDVYRLFIPEEDINYIKSNFIETNSTSFEKEKLKTKIINYINSI